MNRDVRIVFMGTPDFAVSILEALVQAGHEVVLAVTQPDKPKGRGKALQFSPVKEAVLRYQQQFPIDLYQPKRIRDAESVEHLKAYAPDVAVVAAFGQVLPKEILELPKYGCINVHASLLPKYRGAAPIQWAVINGEKVTGVTTMQMDAGIDTGDILEKMEVPLSESETGGSLFSKLALAGAKLIVQTLGHIADGSIVPTKQNEEEATYVGMISKDMGRIDWNKPAEEIERLVRGLDPWPSAFTVLHNKTFKIWESAVCEWECQKEGTVNSGQAAPGSVISADKKQIVVQTGKGQLLLREVQLEGKKRMKADAFLRGYPIEAGTVLG